jgi:hypothetical protein
MNQFTKMAMVPHAMVDPLRYQEVGAPLLSQLSTLDGEMQTILGDKTIPDELKLQKYMQTLQRYQMLKGQQVMQPAPAATRQTLVPVMEDLLDTIPKQDRNKAKIFVNHLQQHADEIKWTEDGRLIYENKPVEGSNRTDLVHQFTRKLPPKNETPGAVELASLLKKTNVPSVAVSKPIAMAKLDSPGLNDMSFGTPSGSPSLGVLKSPLSKKQHKVIKNIQKPPVREPSQRTKKPVDRYGNMQGHGKWVSY